MNDMMHVELTKSEQELLLRGLRYVRSSIMLDPCDPTEEVVDQRKRQLKEVAALVEQIQGSAGSRTTARV